MAASDSNISVTPHGVSALDVYKFFSRNASAAGQKRQVKDLMSRHTFACINQIYYLQSTEQLDQFLDLFKPRARNGETADQQRARFSLEHAHLWEKLPATLATGKTCLLTQDAPFVTETRP